MLFSIWIRQATCNQVTISDYLDLLKKIPFFHSMVWHIYYIMQIFFHYLVNIIVVNGLVELVVEIIQELDSLSGSTLSSELSKANNIPKEEGGVFIHPAYHLHCFDP